MVAKSYLVCNPSFGFSWFRSCKNRIMDLALNFMSTNESHHYKIWPSRSYEYVGIMSLAKTNTIIEKEHNFGWRVHGIISTSEILPKEKTITTITIVKPL